MTHILDLGPAETRDLVERGHAQLIDVREGFEHASEHIPGALHHPLSAFDAGRVRELSAGKRAVFQCRSGKRSRDAATRFGGDEAHHLAGGIEAWKGTGLPTERSAGAPPIDVMRQVQVVAGSLVLLGVVLGTLVHPGFLGVSAFVGAGLTFAGLSGWCGMAKLLGAMPWNRA